MAVGGVSATGGAAATGGVTTNGGLSTAGGTSTLTSSAAGGLATAQGGATPSGGTVGLGGANTVAGSPSQGGNQGTAGTGAAGGVTSTTTWACAGAVVTPAQLGQVNISFLLDKSASMGYQSSASGYWDNCAERWNPVVDTLNSFFAQANSSRLYASLTFVPADGNAVNTNSSGDPTISGTICDPNSYSSSAGLKVPLTLLDAAGRQMFEDLLCDCAYGTTPPKTTCIVPAGGTPTRAALVGTLDYAATVAKDNPASKTVIVMITDGEPSFYCGGKATGDVCNSCDDLTNGCYTNGTGCTDQVTEIDKITAVIQGASGVGGTNPKSIFVVGVGTDLNNSTAFDDWSTASGNQGIDLRNMTGASAASALLQSIESIRSASFSCAFDLPMPNNGTVNPLATNVYYIDGSGSGAYLTRTSDGTSNTCAANTKSWYFDNPNQPKQIQLCPTACSALQQDAKATLQVEYGCATVTQ